MFLAIWQRRMPVWGKSDVWIAVRFSVFLFAHDRSGRCKADGTAFWLLWLEARGYGCVDRIVSGGLMGFGEDVKGRQHALQIFLYVFLPEGMDPERECGSLLLLGT